MPDTSMDIVREAREHLVLCQAHEQEIRKESDRCMRFLALEQWDQADLEIRAGRVSIVIDQLGQYRDQVVNDWRRNRLGVKVSHGDGGDDETARIFDGIIRQIEYKSKAHIAYDHAFECMTGGNRGYCEVSTRRRPGSMKQDIVILKIPNPDSVYIDPFCSEIDYSDMQFAIKTDVMSRALFKRKFPKAGVLDFTEAASSSPSWFPDSESLIVAEYWTVEETPRKIQLLTAPITVVRQGNGLKTDEVYDDEYTDLPEGVEVALNADGDRMEDDEPKRTVWHYLLNGAEVLEKTKWLGAYIPIIPWYGKEVWYQNKKKLFSLISRSLDAQKVFNFAQSSMAERLGRSTLSPVVAAEGQLAGFENIWQQAATKAFTHLPYKPISIGDHLVPPPQRADYDPHIEQVVLASNITKDNIRGTMGINTAMLGQDTGKAKSGIAVKELSREGDNATFDFMDNGGRAIELVGSIIVDLIPRVYSRADILQIRDEQARTISIAVNQDMAQMPEPPKDQKRSYFLANGNYHVAVSASPSHESLRQEGQTRMTELLQYLPPEDQKAAIPVILRLSEFYGSRELADKIDPPKPSGQNIPPQLLQQMTAQQKMIQQLTQELNALIQEREAKTPELQARWQESCLNAYTKIRIAEITASKDADKQDADIQAQQLAQMFDAAHDVGIAALQHQQGMEAAAQQPQDAAPEPARAPA